MFLLERIIGVVTYMLIMIVIVINIYKSPKEKLKKILCIYLFILVMMAFYYIPSQSADLYRLQDSLYIYSKYSFSELVSKLYNSNVPAYILYVYIIGKIGIPNFLPAITCLIFYGIIFKILLKSSKKYNLSNKNIALSLLFFMITGKFLEVISSVRALLSFSIIALCCYEEFVEEKAIYKNIFKYCIAIFFHPAALALTIIRFLYLFLKREKKIIKKIINYIILLFMGIVLFRYGLKYLDFMLVKADVYLNNEVYSYVWEYIISWIFILFSTYSIISRKRILMKKPEIYELAKFNIYINFIIILFSFEYSIFSRFQTFSSIIFMPILALIFSEINKEVTNNNKVYYFIFIIFITVLFFLVGIRGNLSGYKYLLF